VEVAKALGGAFKLVTLAPRTVREMTPLLRGVFLVKHLASTDNQNNREIEYTQTQTNNTPKLALINSKNTKNLC